MNIPEAITILNENEHRGASDWQLMNGKETPLGAFSVTAQVHRPFVGGALDWQEVVAIAYWYVERWAGRSESK